MENIVNVFTAEAHSDNPLVTISRDELRYLEACRDLYRAVKFGYPADSINLMVARISELQKIFLHNR